MPSGDRGQLQRGIDPLVEHDASLLAVGALAWAVPQEESGPQERDGSEPAWVKTSMAGETVLTCSSCVAAAFPGRCVWGVDPWLLRVRMETGSAPVGAGGHL